MTQTAHTPWPTKADDISRAATQKISASDYSLYEADGTRIAEFCYNKGCIPWAWAARIVACVNYCAGMTADELERSTAVSTRNDRDLLRAQNAELVAALRHVLEDDGLLPRATSSCRAHVRAALAKAST